MAYEIGQPLAPLPIKDNHNLHHHQKFDPGFYVQWHLSANRPTMS